MRVTQHDGRSYLPQQCNCAGDVGGATRSEQPRGHGGGTTRIAERATHQHPTGGAAAFDGDRRHNQIVGIRHDKI